MEVGLFSGALSFLGSVAGAFGSIRAGRSVQHGAQEVAGSVDRASMRLADAALKVGNLWQMQAADTTIRALESFEGVSNQWLEEVERVTTLAVESFNGNVELAVTHTRNLSDDWQRFLRELNNDFQAKIKWGMKLCGGFLFLNTLLLCVMPPVIFSELQGTTNIVAVSRNRVHQFLYSLLYEPVRPADVISEMFSMLLVPVLSSGSLVCVAREVYRRRLNESRTDALQRQLLRAQQTLTAQQQTPPEPPQVPVGSILAYTSHLFAQARALPHNFMRCDGQEVRDVDSPLDGQTLPDLNNSTGNGTPGRFLRGSMISGVLQDDSLQGHGHLFQSRGDSAQSPGNHGTDSGGHSGTRDWSSPAKVVQPVALQSYGEPRIADETRPTNMSVIWIMRIK